jgi:hypothetical protein
MRSRHFFTCSSFQVSKPQGHSLSSLAQASGHNRHGNTLQASAQDVLSRAGTQHSCRSTTAPGRREQAKPASRREPSCPTGSIAAVTTPQNMLPPQAWARESRRAHESRPPSHCRSYASKRAGRTSSRRASRSAVTWEGARARTIAAPRSCHRGYRGRGPPPPLGRASCWGPSASEGPQKQDLTVFLEYNVWTGIFGPKSASP